MDLPLPIPETLRTLKPYGPGKPIEETQREFGIRRVVKLASNENPLGPSPKAVAAAKAALKEAHRYPDGAAYRLKQALSKANRAYGVSPSQWVIGTGSNEIIDLLVRSFTVPGDFILTPEKAFIAYRISAQAHGAKLLESRLVSAESFEWDLEDLVAKAPQAKLVFLPNPNNPTGSCLPSAEMENLVDRLIAAARGRVIIIVDDAYGEYVALKGWRSPLALLKRHPRNVVVLKTFSKVYGLGGMRVGYSASSDEIASVLDRIRAPFNVSAPALASAEAALSDAAFVRRSLAVNRKGMKDWASWTRRRNIRCLTTQGNFVLLETRAAFGLTGPELQAKSLPKGVILRPLANYGILEWIRVSVGTEQENRFAQRVLDGLCK